MRLFSFVLGAGMCMLAAVFNSAAAHPSEHGYPAEHSFRNSVMHHAPRGFDDDMFLSSIDSIKRDGQDDDLVLLRGRLTKYYGDELYEFTDLDGDTIEVKLDDDDYWSNIYKDQLIDIVGKLDVDMFSILVKVRRAAPLEPPPGAAAASGTTGN